MYSSRELASCLILLVANCFCYLLPSCILVIHEVIWNVEFKEKGKKSTWEDESLVPHGLLYQFSEHRWNKCMRNSVLSWANSLPQLLLGILLAAVSSLTAPTHPANQGCFRLSQKYRLNSPGLGMYKESSSWSSGAVAKKAVVWYMSKKQGRNKWLLYRIMLCGSSGRKHPGASQSQMTGMGIVTERSPQIWL